MPNELVIALSPETLDAGSAEERATFGLFSMTANNHLLTEGVEVDKQELRHGPYVSGYPIAEWMAWNWWRLRWETGYGADTNAISPWHFAHRMTTIGGGYAWPNITIFSDGVYSSLLSTPSRSPETSLFFRYIGASGSQMIPADSLEMAIDGFVEDTLTKLDAADVRGTNLHCLWTELKMEREDNNLTRFRRLEAQLGYDPDEADEDAIHHRLEDAMTLGEEALGEIAADATFGDDALGNMMSAGDLTDIAQGNGFDANPNDAITLSDMTELPQPFEAVAWQLGKLAAQAIRIQERLDASPISDTTLADYAGTISEAISSKRGYPSKISFALDSNGSTRVSLRSRWETGRRFDLARLVGDRVLRNQINVGVEPLLPVTHAFSYRQRAQRAFAAELLSPHAAVADMMNRDYSNEEKQNEVAEHFAVSLLTIQNQLRNGGYIGRDDAPDLIDRSLAA